MNDDSIKIGFIEEGEQLVEEMETLLLGLEQVTEKQETIDGIFRIVHNIKGSAKAVGFDQLGVFCHELETYLLTVKNGTQKVTKSVIDLLLASRDAVALALTKYKTDLNAVVAFDVDFSAVADDETSQRSSVSSAAGSLVMNDKRASAAAGDGSVRVNLKRVDKLINAVGELVVLDSVLRQRTTQAQDPTLSKTVEQVGKIIREVQDLSMSLRMVPVKPLIQKLQRICRDTSAELNKEVDFKVVGEEIEIDKTILDSIGDPLVHLLRNAVDHGLETANARKVHDKNPVGSLLLSILHEGGKLVIRLKDDGQGLDRDRITAKALEKGLITSGEALSEQQIHQLIFAPGFSTKAAVTEVSGRGVGMDVVRTCVESLGGQIEIASEFNKGTEFVIGLPLTVAIIEGMVVKTSKENFIVPFSQVSETVKISDSELNKGSESGTLLNLRGQFLPVYSLQELLGGKKEEKKNGIGVITKSAGFSFIILVDDVVGQQQIVVKQLGAELSGFKRFAGSGVLGDGKPALILDLTQLAGEEIMKARM